MRILRLPVAGAGVYFRHSLVPVRRRATADLVRQRLYHQSAAGTVNHDLRCTKYSPEHPGKALFGPAMMALLAALIVLLCAFVVQPVKLLMATGLKPAAGGSVRSFSAWPAVHCQPAQYPAANFWLLPDGKRLPSGAGASCGEHRNWWK